MASSGRKVQSIGPYEVHEKIGKGSFATVYRGNHKDTKHKVAIKGINLSKANVKETSCIKSEISILRALQHPNIVRLLDFKRTTNHIYLIMEYCAGGDLSKYIKKHGPIPEKNCRSILRQLASGLECLRENKLMHRDLKPANLLIEREVDLEGLVLKIADFGFARHLGAMDMAETRCGTPLYMAPEILECKLYDSAAELWSVGAILYEMVTGKPPFKAPNQAHLLRTIKATGKGLRVDKTLRKKLRLSNDCVGMIESLLKVNPKDRISFEDFFKHPFLSIDKSVMEGGARQPAVVKPIPVHPIPQPTVVAQKSTSHFHQGEYVDPSLVQPESAAVGEYVSPELVDEKTDARVLPEEKLSPEYPLSKPFVEHNHPKSGLARQLEQKAKAQKSQTLQENGDYVMINPEVSRHIESNATSAWNRPTKEISIKRPPTEQARRYDSSSSYIPREQHVPSDKDIYIDFSERAKRALLVSSLGESDEQAHLFPESVKLYIRSVELFHEITRDARKWATESKAASSEIRQKMSKLRKWAKSMCKTFHEKARSLTGFLVGHEPMELSVEELIYTRAIKIAKDAAFDEMVGSASAAKTKYKTALRLFQQLYNQPEIDPQDVSILRRFMTEFKTRIEAVETKMTRAHRLDRD
ncbi:hypothetical protein AAMO2058_001273900 [Amorphochlora amoebiformis]|mmetsp:Transcript_15678/g.24821  ORF Transcript_15678/g.24821 Transcript_15678/m.24821 type:complete len:641 (-) Transcript_15678:251-2173(-)